MSNSVRSSSIHKLFISQLNLLLCLIFGGWILFRLIPNDGTNATAFLAMDIIFLSTSVLVTLLRPFARPSAYTISAVIFAYVALDLLVLYVFTMNNAGRFTGGLFTDFLYSDKYFLYVMLLGIFASSRVVEGRTVKVLLMMFLAGCFIKYGYSRILYSGERPRLLLENNYELMMVLILFVMYTAVERWHSRRPSHYLVALLGFIVVLSGSRSALVAFVPVLVLLYAKPTARHFVLLLVMIPPAFYVVVTVFQSRIGASGRIDRLQFLGIFLDELDDFRFWNYLIGLKPLSPLNPQSCQQVAYYKSLFSAQENGECYAPVLHSYVLRALHDHGVIGTVLPFVAVAMFLRGRQFSVGERACLIGIALLCGFSVAGIGANFVAFPLALACALHRPSAPGERSRMGDGELAPRQPALQN